MVLSRPLTLGGVSTGDTLPAGRPGAAQVTRPQVRLLLDGGRWARPPPQLSPGVLTSASAGACLQGAGLAVLRITQSAWSGDVWKLTVSVVTFHGNSEKEKQASALEQVWVVLYGWPHVFHLPRSPLPPLPSGPGWNRPSSGVLQLSVLTLVWNSAYRAQEGWFSSQDCLPCQAVLFLRSGRVSSYFLMTKMCCSLRPAPGTLR